MIIALIAAYNVPELTDLQLVLSLEVIAAIYENRLTMWNDQRIKDLNSANVSNALPDEPIIVVTTSAVSARTQLFTTALSRSVPEFTVLEPPAMQMSRYPYLRSCWCLGRARSDCYVPSAERGESIGCDYRGE